ncbi:unnamed protein product [Chondrus crispus]|uniref:Uncharacterized protein n=1 Tax=Chondrus crispus TaxID=2769 RepID=R7QIL6_CHOCR|nr:unnamed protein product [Chondrus crispus]CDF37321.1 unnamed protein product [Chondrus crispus]|eukprot:XP_005717140.1 unnamed protein product [Chondrus crispus]
MRQSVEAGCSTDVVSSDALQFDGWKSNRLLCIWQISLSRPSLVNRTVFGSRKTRQEGLAGANDFIRSAFGNFFLSYSTYVFREN